jgi:tetratricopeptide (TPR) repeat protein
MISTDDIVISGLNWNGSRTRAGSRKAREEVADPSAARGPAMQGHHSFITAMILTLFIIALAPFARVFAQESSFTTQQTVSVNQLRAPGKARKALDRARQALIHGRLEQAAAQIDRALKVYPNFALAFVTRGSLRIRQNRLEEASIDFQQAIRNDPNLGAGYLGLGATYNLQGRYNEALVPLDQSLQRLPNVWLPHFQIAISYYHSGQYEPALRELTKAEKIGASNPDDWAAMLYLKAEVLLRLNDYSATENNLEQIVARAPKSLAAKLSAQELERLRAQTAQLESARPPQ